MSAAIPGGRSEIERLIAKLRRRAQVETPTEIEKDTYSSPELTWKELEQLSALLCEAADALSALLTAAGSAPVPTDDDDSAAVNNRLRETCGLIARELFDAAAEHNTRKHWLVNQLVANALRCAAHSIAAALTNGAQDWRKELAPLAAGSSVPAQAPQHPNPVAWIVSASDSIPYPHIERLVDVGQFPSGTKLYAADVPPGAAVPAQAPAPALTQDDIDQIAEGIEHFIMNGDPAVDAIWQPCINKLRAARPSLPVQE